MKAADCTPCNLAEAAEALESGLLVAFPTETVYGLGADAENPEAVARIYEARDVRPIILSSCIWHWVPICLTGPKIFLKQHICSPKRSGRDPDTDFEAG
jgi:hypothetical protein